jgi:uncharacterized repeat protein (TIGR03803 family)
MLGFSSVKSVALVLVASAVVFVSSARSQSTEKVLFKTLVGGNGGLYYDQQSNFYGTEDKLTKFGAVYRLHHYLNGTWGFKVLYRFSGPDGAHPASRPVLDNAGNLYGATPNGGANNLGTIFQLTPTPTGWTEKVLYNFELGSDGFSPSGGLVLDSQGNLYGTTFFGPHGTVYELVRNSDSTWTHKVLYVFTGGADGSNPSGNLARDSAGNLYGTAGGGTTGHGTIFELSPEADGTWKFQVLHTFCSLVNCNDGEPGSGSASVRLGPNGNLIGTAYSGGRNKAGTAFKLVHTVTGAWNFQLLHSFCSLDGCHDGAGPDGPLTLDGSGNVYGLTEAGGDPGFGTVFKLSHIPGSPWTETVLYSFCPAFNCSGGRNPTGALAIDTAGNLFGTAFEPTAGNEQYIFEIIP